MEDTSIKVHRLDVPSLTLPDTVMHHITYTFSYLYITHVVRIGHPHSHVSSLYRLEKKS